MCADGTSLIDVSNSPCFSDLHSQTIVLDLYNVSSKAGCCFCSISVIFLSDQYDVSGKPGYCFCSISVVFIMDQCNILTNQGSCSVLSV